MLDPTLLLLARLSLTTSEPASLVELPALVCAGAFDKESTLLESVLRILLNGEGGASLRFGTWGLVDTLLLVEVFLGLGNGMESPTVLGGKEKNKRPSPIGKVSKQVNGGYFRERIVLH